MDDVIQTLERVSQVQQEIIAGNERIIESNNRTLNTIQTAIEQEKQTQQMLAKALTDLGL